jgi:hypothetical protein
VSQVFITASLLLSDGEAVFLSGKNHYLFGVMLPYSYLCISIPEKRKQHTIIIYRDEEIHITAISIGTACADDGAGWRRQDLIRFNQYESLFQGDAFDDKVDESDGHTRLYPIPGYVMALNHNLQQNPGY